MSYDELADLSEQIDGLHARIRELEAEVHGYMHAMRAARLLAEERLSTIQMMHAEFGQLVRRWKRRVAKRECAAELDAVRRGFLRVPTAEGIVEGVDPTSAEGGE